MDDLVATQSQSVWKLSLLMLLISTAAAVLNEDAWAWALLVVAAANAAFCQFGVVRYARRQPRTIWWFYTFLCRGMLCLFIAVLNPLIAIYVLLIGFEGSHAWVFLMALLAIAVHQCWRGRRLVFRKWQTADDVWATLQGVAGAGNQESGRRYDAAFACGVIVVVSFLGHLLGDGFVAAAVTTGYALLAPYLVSVTWASRSRVKQLFPRDAALDQPRGGPERFWVGKV